MSTEITGLLLWQNRIHDINLELTDPRLHARIRKCCRARDLKKRTEYQYRNYRIYRTENTINYGRLMLGIIFPKSFKNRLIELPLN